MGLKREKKTIEAMIGLYCRGHHNSNRDLCAQCQTLLDYAFVRLEKCPYGETKPVCSKCTTHCYKADMRDRVRTVMRWSGPRMLIHHPFLAIDHLVKTLK